MEDKLKWIPLEFSKGQRNMNFLSRKDLKRIGFKIFTKSILSSAES
jgi:hypothetical protein